MLSSKDKIIALFIDKLLKACRLNELPVGQLVAVKKQMQEQIEMTILNEFVNSLNKNQQKEFSLLLATLKNPSILAEYIDNHSDNPDKLLKIALLTYKKSFIEQYKSELQAQQK